MLVAIVTAISGVAGMAAVAIGRRWPVAGPSAEATHRLASGSTRRGRFARFLRARLDPTAGTGPALTLTLAFVVAAGTVVGVLVYLLRTHPALAAADLWAAQWGAAHAMSFSTAVFRATTQLGATVTIVVVGSVVGWSWPFDLVAFRPCCSSRSSWGQRCDRESHQGACRPRPSGRVRAHRLHRPIVPQWPLGWGLRRAMEPSRFVLSLRWSSKNRAAAYGAAVAVAVAVACSRVLLGVHWVSDVVAGLAIGWSWLALCLIAFGGRRLRFGAPPASGWLTGEA